MRAALRATLALLLPCVMAACTLPAPEPVVGQQGKDVVWLPTSQALVEKMLDLARVGPQDTVIDLGSGDGRTVIAAAQRGARALGIEYQPELVALSRRNAEAAGVAARTRFVAADLFETDLSQATVISMFLLPAINLRLRPVLLELKPGTRIVSNTFGMGEWLPDARAAADPENGNCGAYCTALLWIVPARVGGTHALPQGELTLKQEFQVVSGTLRTRGAALPVEGKVRGDALVLSAGGREYRGRVREGKLELR